MTTSIKFSPFFLLVALISLQCSLLHGQNQSHVQEMEVLLESNHISVVKAKDQEGFSVVTTDERLPQLLGYSETGSFDPENIPSNMQFWLDCINYACDEYLAGRVSYEEAFGAAKASASSVAPLLGDIAWSQEEPYNQNCPQIKGTPCVTGCGATALAMLMAYYQYPNAGTGSHSYTTSTNRLRVSYNFAENSFDWGNIRDSYSIAYDEPLQKESVSSSTEIEMTYCDLVPFATYGGVYVYLDSLWNYATADFSGYVQFLLYDKNGNFLEPVGERVALTDELSLPSKSYYPQYPIIVSIPNKYADGEYSLKLAKKSTASKSWHLCHHCSWVTFTADYTTLKVTKMGEKITIGDYSGFTQYTSEEADAVANLMFACGVACNMDYGTDASAASTYAAMQGSVNYFGYDKDVYIGYSDHMTTTSKNEMIIAELEAQRPVYLGGITSNREGHAFIADGYRTQSGRTMFHINWGWNGMSNGYFQITNLNPSSTGTGASNGDNFSATTYIFTGMKPDDGVNYPQAIGCTRLTSSATEVKTGDRITLTASALMNVSCKTLNGTVYALLQTEDGTEYNAGTFATISRYDVTTYSNKSGSITIPDNIPSGQYKIVLRVGENNLFGPFVTKESPTINVTNTTGIIDAIGIKAEGQSYDLQGRKVGREAKGIVVRDNRLILENKR